MLRGRRSNRGSTAWEWAASHWRTRWGRDFEPRFGRDPDILKQYKHWKVRVVFTTTRETQKQVGSRLKSEIDDAMREIRNIRNKAETIRARLAVALGTESKS